MTRMLGLPLRGWQAAERERFEAAAALAISPAERAKGLEALARLRAKLPFLAR